MNGSGLSASDVLAITRNNDGMDFGGVGGFILLFIFLMAIGGNGFGFGGSSGGFALADIQNSLYNQSQDANARALAQGQCGINENILNASYNNLLANKDISTQIANQTAVITNAMNSNTNAILSQMQTNVIDDLRDKLSVTRDELSNVRQTATITENILSNLATTAPKPPCYYGYGCGSSLY
jgi:hypothetical protein